MPSSRIMKYVTNNFKLSAPDLGWQNCLPQRKDIEVSYTIIISYLQQYFAYCDLELGTTNERKGSYVNERNMNHSPPNTHISFLMKNNSPLQYNIMNKFRLM